MWLIALILALMAVPVQAQTVYYLSPVQGAGTDADPYRALKSGTWNDCTDLRSNPTLGAGYLLCAGPSVPGGAIAIPTDLTTRLTTLQKTALQTVLGKTVTATTVQDFIGEMVVENGVSLRRLGDGRNHLYLRGKDLWSRPAPIAWRELYLAALRFPVTATDVLLDAVFSAPLAWAASVSNSFNCANNASLTCDGVTVTEFSGSSWGIVSNTAQLSNTVATNAARMEFDLNSNSMLVGATITALNRNSATEAHVGLIARKENSATITYYYGMGKDLAGTDEYEFGHVVTGSRTALGTSTADTPSVGDLMELIIDGDQLSFRVNGVVLLGPTTNTSITGDFRRAGLRSSGSGTADNTVGLDNWYARDYTVRRPIAPLVAQ